MTGIESVRRAVTKIMDSTEMARVKRNVGRECANLVAEHFLDINGESSHHKTIGRLGAQSSDFLDRASGQVSFSLTGDGVDIDVNNTPGLSRAFHDLDIRAKDKPLTIPTDAESYQFRAGELKRKGWLLFRPKKASGERLPYLFGTKKATKGRGRKAKTVRETRLMYVLKDHVHIRKDRTLLPSDEQIVEAASAAVRMQLDRDGLL